jgi:hypothetical protein
MSSWTWWCKMIFLTIVTVDETWDVTDGDRV